MRGSLDSMVSQFVFVQTPDIVFATLVEELGEALDRSGAGDRVTQWDCDDLALMDIGGLRFALAWCQHPQDEEAACLTLAVGPAPEGTGRPLSGANPEEMCQMLARRLESVLLPDMTFWHRVDGPVDADVIDRLIDNLPDVGVMRSIGAFRAKPRTHAAVQAAADADADIEAILARVAEPEAPAPRPETPRATANSTVADPPAEVVDLLSRLGADAPARRAARRSATAATVPLTAAATARVLDLDTDPRAAAASLVLLDALADDDLPQPLPDATVTAPTDTARAAAAARPVADVDPYAIEPEEDEIEAPAPARPIRPAPRDAAPATPRPAPDETAADTAPTATDAPEAETPADAPALTVADQRTVEELARLRCALYPPEADAPAPEAPSAQLRLAAHAMDATLIAVVPPLGAALMTYGLLRGPDLMRSGRAMAVTCTLVGLAQGPLLALI